MLRRLVLFVLLASVSLVVGAGCGGSDDSAADGDDTARIAYFAPLVNGYIQAEYKGMQEGAEAEGGTMQLFDAKLDSNTQISQIEDAAASGNFDAFVIEPVDSTGVVRAVEAANEADIPVIALFTPIGPDLLKFEPQVEGIVSVVGQPIDDNGGLLGDLTVEACEGKDPCEVLLMPGLLQLPDEKLRLDAANAVIAQHPNIKVVATQQADYLAEKGLSVTQNVLQANPGLDVVTALGDQMTRGAEIAVKNAGKQGEIALIGNGGGTYAIKAIRDGRWLGAPVAVPYTYGIRTGELAVQAARGEEVPASVVTADLSPIGPVAKQDSIGDFQGEYSD